MLPLAGVAGEGAGHSEAACARAEAGGLTWGSAGGDGADDFRELPGLGHGCWAGDLPAVDAAEGVRVDQLWYRRVLALHADSLSEICREGASLRSAGDSDRTRSSDRCVPRDLPISCKLHFDQHHDQQRPNTCLPESYRGLARVHARVCAAVQAAGRHPSRSVVAAEPHLARQFDPRGVSDRGGGGGDVCG
eukprot:7330186-Prymnesium_polylepis.1